MTRAVWPGLLRPVTPADVPTFLAVMLAAGMDPRSSWSRTTEADLHASLFGPGAGGLLAERGEEVLGCVGFRPDGARTLTLNKLATIPQVRGQGVGVALVRAVEHLAAGRGFARVLLAVSQYNLSVLPFYEQLGYGRTDERYAHASASSPAPVVLVRTLGPDAGGSP